MTNPPTEPAGLGTKETRQTRKQLGDFLTAVAVAAGGLNILLVTTTLCYHGTWVLKGKLLTSTLATNSVVISCSGTSFIIFAEHNLNIKNSSPILCGRATMLFTFRLQPGPLKEVLSAIMTSLKGLEQMSVWMDDRHLIACQDIFFVCVRNLSFLSFPPSFLCDCHEMLWVPTLWTLHFLFNFVSFFFFLPYSWLLCA